MSAEPPPGLTDDDAAWYLEHVVVAEAGRESPAQTGWRLLADQLRRSGPISASAAGQGFVVTRAQAARAGAHDVDSRRLVRGGEWWRPRRGVLAPFPRPVATKERVVFEVAAAAVARRHHVVRGRSACQLHDRPLVGPARPDVDLIGPSSRRLPNLSVRPASLDASEITSWYGIPVTSLSRTIWDAARTDRGHGLVVADAALRRRVVTKVELLSAGHWLASFPGFRRAGDLLAHADGLSESPLESLTRLMIIDADLPLPELQVEIPTPGRYRPDRVDMFWSRHRLILEADGREKYTGDELWNEKVRQERLEQAGYRVIRVRWAEVVHRPTDTVARISAALRLVQSPMSHRGD